MKDISPDQRAALRVLIGCGVYALRTAGNTADKITAAMSLLAPYAFSPVIDIPPPKGRSHAETDVELAP